MRIQADMKREGQSAEKEIGEEKRRQQIVNTEREQRGVCVCLLGLKEHLTIFIFLLNLGFFCIKQLTGQ